MYKQGLLFELLSVSQNPNKGSHIVLSSEIDGGHIYLLSPVLVTLHSAEPLGPVASQMCSPVLSSHWAETFLDVPWCLSVTGLLSGESQHRGSLSALPPRWQASNGVWIQASLAPLSSSPTNHHLHLSSSASIHIHSRLLLVIFASLSLLCGPASLSLSWGWVTRQAGRRPGPE